MPNALAPHAPQTTTQRQELCRAVVAGHIDDAIAMCDAISPAILSGRPGLRFRLQVQCFVEMMRGGRHEDAQSYALRGEPFICGPGRMPL